MPETESLPEYLNSYTVLFVDDEPSILHALRRLLRREPYKKIFVESGEEALNILREQRVQLIITDQRMPEMSGTEFLEKTSEIPGDPIRIIISGYADITSIVKAINEGGIYRFIPKPWDDEELKGTIRHALEHYHLREQNQRMTEELREKARQLEQANQRLQQLTEERTRSLHAFQGIIHYFPFPFLAINRELDFIYANATGMELLNKMGGLIPGDNISELFPNSIISQIEQTLISSTDDSFYSLLIPMSHESLPDATLLVSTAGIQDGAAVFFMPAECQHVLRHVVNWWKQQDQPHG
ncbi:MAG: response regulator [Lentisphaerae bacterium]|nr:MAG: response regulator [Lentisphaerota bacterium]